MKVLVVTNMYPSKAKPHYGAFVQSCVSGYEKCGVNVDVVSLERGGWFGYVLFYFSAFFTSVFGRYCLVHIHYVSHSAPPVLFARIFRNFRLALNFHGSDAFPESYEGKYRRRFKELACKVAIRFSDFIIVPSEYFLQKMRSAYSVADSIVSPSGGVDSSLFTFTNNGSRTVMFAGRLIPEKGGVIAAEAIRDNINLIDRVIFVGAGPDEGRIKSILKGVDVEYYGMLPRSDLARLMNESDVLLFPSQREGESLGLVLVEAVFSGCIPVAIENGAVSEVVNDIYLPLLIGDRERFSSLLTGVMSMSVNERKGMAEALYVYARERYSSSKVSETLFKNVSSRL